jgi:P-type Ca2+ transporter type 2C
LPFPNIRKTLQYLLASNTGELLLVTLSVAVGLPLPLLPVHLLWINLVTDGPPALCLAAEPIDSDVLRRAPRPVSAPLADRAFLSRILLAGVLAAATAVCVFAYFIKTTTPEEARTAAFTFLVFAQLLLSLGFRSERQSLWKLPLLRNWKLFAVIAVSIGFQIVATQNAAVGGWLKIAALSSPALFVLLTLACIPLLGLESAKRWSGRTEPCAGSEPGPAL